jgi:hypothetical protein
MPPRQAAMSRHPAIAQVPTPRPLPLDGMPSGQRPRPNRAISSVDGRCIRHSRMEPGPLPRRASETRREQARWSCTTTTCDLDEDDQEPSRRQYAGPASPGADQGPGPAAQEGARGRQADRPGRARPRACLGTLRHPPESPGLHGRRRPPRQPRPGRQGGRAAGRWPLLEWQPRPGRPAGRRAAASQRDRSHGPRRRRRPARHRPPDGDKAAAIKRRIDAGQDVDQAEAEWFMHYTAQAAAAMGAAQGKGF